MIFIFFSSFSAAQTWSKLLYMGNQIQQGSTSIPHPEFKVDQRAMVPPPVAFVLVYGLEYQVLLQCGSSGLLALCKDPEAPTPKTPNMQPRYPKGMGAEDCCGGSADTPPKCLLPLCPVSTNGNCVQFPQM